MYRHRYHFVRPVIRTPLFLINALILLFLFSAGPRQPPPKKRKVRPLPQHPVAVNEVRAEVQVNGEAFFSFSDYLPTDASFNMSDLTSFQ